MDNDGLLLCDLQARTFELSLTKQKTSSAIFIRRFMNSDIVKIIDNRGILQTTIQPWDLIEMIDEEYGVSDYGTVKYSSNEMYWIGYIYRYYCFTYEKSSRQAYRIIKPKELRDLYLPYHTLDPLQAVDRILEAKGLLLDEEGELMRQYQIFKQIRNRQ